MFLLVQRAQKKKTVPQVVEWQAGGMGRDSQLIYKPVFFASCKLSPKFIADMFQSKLKVLHEKVAIPVPGKREGGRGRGTRSGPRRGQ